MQWFKIDDGQWIRKGGSRDVQENILAEKKKSHFSEDGAAGPSRSTEPRDFDDQVRMTLDWVT